MIVPASPPLRVAVSVAVHVTPPGIVSTDDLRVSAGLPDMRLAAGASPLRIGGRHGDE